MNTKNSQSLEEKEDNENHGHVNSGTAQNGINIASELALSLLNDHETEKRKFMQAENPLQYQRKRRSRKDKSEELDWKVMYAILMDYCAKHGDCNVPPDLEYECIISMTGTEESSFQYRGPLGQWLAEELQKISRKRDSRTLEERTAFQALVSEGKLRQYDPSIGEDGALLKVKRPRGKPSQVDWPVNFAALMHFRQQNGHCNVLQKTIYECTLTGFGGDGGEYTYCGRLGKWLDNQRQFKKAGRLAPERVEALQSLVDEGVWAWRASSHTNGQGGDEWSRHYQALLEYCRQKGDCNVQQKEIFECLLPGVNCAESQYRGGLGKWLDNQRRQHRTGKLHPSRVALLQALVDEGKLVWRVRKKSDIALMKDNVALFSSPELQHQYMTELVHSSTQSNSRSEELPPNTDNSALESVELVV